tara:strand:- start:501 stop:1076 length:576 start_codon:yes stop_codon:yes gene_type:complete
MAVIIATIFLFSCDSNKNITSFKIKNPYLSDRDRNFVLNVDSQTIVDKNSNIVNENVSISIFPGEAGGIKQNVNRWRRQLNLTPLPIDNINKEVMNNPLLGDYYLFHETNDKENKSIIAAIIPQKDNTIFIKMNTSALLSNDRKYEFTLFCQSLYLDEAQELVWNAPKGWIEKEPINMSKAFFEIKHSDEN